MKNVHDIPVCTSIALMVEDTLRPQPIQNCQLCKQSDATHDLLDQTLWEIAICLPHVTPHVPYTFSLPASTIIER
jgi:hypothetical protein